MALASIVRTRIITLMMSGTLPITERALLNRIGKSYRSQAQEQISLLLSEQFLIRLGLGRRGSPYQLIFGPNASITCPCCGQPTNLVQNG